MLLKKLTQSPEVVSGVYDFLKISVENSPLRSLPRGAKYIKDTSVGPVQVGCPPETVKDTMDWSKGFPPTGVPQVVVVRDSLFDLHNKCISEELEFLVYYNFFLHKRPLKIVCAPEQMERIKTILQTAIFGLRLSKSEFAKSYPENYPEHLIPDLAKEFAEFSGETKLEDMVEFYPFDSQSNSVEVDAVHEITKIPGKIKIEKNGNNHFSIYDPLKNQEFLNIPAKPVVPYQPLNGTIPDKYKNLRNKVTILSSTSGFNTVSSKHNPDHEFGTTVSFIIWDDIGNATIVDPPPNTANWLRMNGIDPARISNVVLTHTHADHDAGTKEFILTHHVNIYTTETIMKAFLQKTSAYTGLGPNQLMQHFDFYPIQMYSPTRIGGFTYNFSHSIHPNETISFVWEDREQNAYYYSSDILYDSTWLNKYVAKGVITEDRKNEILKKEVLRRVKLIIQEQGIAPIHTPPEGIVELKSYTDAKTYIVHTDQLPKINGEVVAGVDLATPGMVIDLVTPAEMQDDISTTFNVLGQLNSIALFKNIRFSTEEIQEILSIFKERKIYAGQPIIKLGDDADKAFIIKKGTAQVLLPESKNGNGNSLAKPAPIYVGPGNLLGESISKPGAKRTATVIADSDMVVWEFDRLGLKKLEDSKSIIGKLIRRMRKLREMGVDRALAEMPILKDLSPEAIQEFMRLLSEHKINKEEDRWLIKQGDKLDYLYILMEGKADVIIEEKDGKRKMAKVIATAENGWFGEYSILTNAQTSASVHLTSTLDQTKVFRVSKSAFKSFLRNNPDVRFRFEMMMKERVNSSDSQRQELAVALEELAGEKQSVSVSQEQIAAMQLITQRLLTQQDIYLDEDSSKEEKKK